MGQLVCNQANDFNGQEYQMGPRRSAGIFGCDQPGTNTSITGPAERHRLMVMGQAPDGFRNNPEQSAEGTYAYAAIGAKPRKLPKKISFGLK